MIWLLAAYGGGGSCGNPDRRPRNHLRPAVGHFTGVQVRPEWLG